LRNDIDAELLDLAMARPLGRIVQPQQDFKLLTSRLKHLDLLPYAIEFCHRFLPHGRLLLFQLAPLRRDALELFVKGVRQRVLRSVAIHSYRLPCCRRRGRTAGWRGAGGLASLSFTNSGSIMTERRCSLSGIW